MINYIETLIQNSLPAGMNIYNRLSYVNSKDTKYPCIAYDIKSIVDNEDYVSYELDFMYADLYKNDSTVNQHFDTGIAVIKDFINTVDQTESVSRPYTFDVNSCRYADVLDCTLATLTILIENKFDCE